MTRIIQSGFIYIIATTLTESSVLKSRPETIQMEAVIAESKILLDEPTENLAAMSDTTFRPDIFLPVKLSSSAFTGVVDVSEIEFDDAYEELFNLMEADRCSQSLGTFWIARPLWFIPSVAEIELARRCLHRIALRLSSSDGEILAPEQSAILTRTVTQLLPVLFSPKAIVHTRTRKSALARIENHQDKLSNFQLFQQYMHSHPKLSNLLFQSSRLVNSGAIFPDPLLSINAEGFTLSGFDDRLAQGSELVHLSDFLDYFWAQQALAQNGKVSLPLWKALVDIPGLDSEILQFESEKQSVVQNVIADFRNRISHYDVQMGVGVSSWFRTVGSLIRHLFESSPSGVRACIPNTPLANEILFYPNEITWETIDLTDFATLRQLFYFITSHVHVVPSLYLCIAEGVETGAINLTDTDSKGEHVATLMHLIKLGTSPSAFILANSE